MKRLNLLASLLLLSSWAQASECDVFKVVSPDASTQSSRLGNGFAYTGQIVVVNDHTLSPDAKTVALKQGSKSWVAEVVSRDFHTDLAILKVTGADFKRCELTSSQSNELVVVGFDKKDNVLSRIPVTLKTAESTKLMVPGFRKSLEVMAAGQVQLQSSQSGSLVLFQNKVTGMITQKTHEGTALGIRAADIDKTAREMMSNKLPKRIYEVDRKNNTFRFKGLKIQKSGVGGVDPHSSKIDPHGSPIQNPYTKDPRAPKPIALEDYEVGAVLATVEDFSLLAQSQPQLARALREAQVNRVFISSVDGIQVRNTMELLRALGECSRCEIDSFWIEVKDPSQVQDDTLKLMGWMSALIAELEKENKPEKVGTIVQSIQNLNPLLAKLLNETEGGRIDPTLKIQVRTQWEKVEKALDLLWHSERTLDILTEIRRSIE